jgi:putative oxidoreductase
MRALTLPWLDKHRDAGLLLLRVGIGVMFMGHGGQKLFEGPERWAALGVEMERFGLGFSPEFWGLLAALAEGGGGLLLALGLFTRLAMFPLAFTMAVAVSRHVALDHSFTRTSHAVEALILFVSVFIIGPGRYSLDQLLFRRRADPA